MHLWQLMVGYGQPFAGQCRYIFEGPACILLVLDDRTAFTNGSSYQDQAPLHGMSYTFPGNLKS